MKSLFSTALDLKVDFNLTNYLVYESSLYLMDSTNFFFRAVHHWMTKNSDNMLKGLKLNLQSIMGSKLPNGLLNFVFKHTYVRKVKHRKKTF